VVVKLDDVDVLVVVLRSVRPYDRLRGCRSIYGTNMSFMMLRRYVVMVTKLDEVVVLVAVAVPVTVIRVVAGNPRRREQNCFAPRPTIMSTASQRMVSLLRLPK